jgi:hypothetical protein
LSVSFSSDAHLKGFIGKMKAARVPIVFRIELRIDLRTLPVHGAKSAVMSAGKRTDRIGRSLVQLEEPASRPFQCLRRPDPELAAQLPGLSSL